ncbi:MAG: aminotransferase class V-fold PLP-dependent enzyme, partial [Pseudomonadales bacterium]
MHALRPDVDPNGLREFSVVYTDRALNHMSQSFQQVMRDIAALLRGAYNAKSAVVVPGGGTFAMEAVARQFATGRRCLVLRNGWFSYRWTQIFEAGGIPASAAVLKAAQIAAGDQAPFAPASIDQVVATIQRDRPALVFAPHVETSSGMLLPDSYLRAVADAVHAVGGLFVLDCIASGTMWVDMAATGVDVLVSAPQKGWSGPPCAGFVMLSEAARAHLDTTTSSSFAADLRKWQSIMDAYESGAHAYHATMPTDSLRVARNAMQETASHGFAAIRAAQERLGQGARALLEARGFPSVAADGFKAPGVVVSYTTDPEIQTGKRFMAQGLQIAAG